MNSGAESTMAVVEKDVQRLDDPHSGILRQRRRSSSTNRPQFGEETLTRGPGGRQARKRGGRQAAAGGHWAVAQQKGGPERGCRAAWRKRSWADGGVACGPVSGRGPTKGAARLVMGRCVWDKTKEKEGEARVMRKEKSGQNI